MISPSVQRLALAVVLAAALAACAPSQPLTRQAPSAETAERLQRAGDHADAARMWLDLAAQTPDREDRYRLSAAGAWLAAGRPDAARRALEELDATALNETDRIRLRLVQGELALLAGDFASAQWQLALPANQVPDDLRPRWEDLNRRLADRREAPAGAAMDQLRTAIAEGSFSPELGLASLIEIPLGTLESLLEQHHEDPSIAPWLDLAFTGRRHLLDPRRLPAALESWQDRHPATGYSAAQAGEWLTAFRAAMPWPEQVAVLLPASGALQRPGRALREGLIARWLELPADDRPELAFHYVDNQAESALGAWFQAREDGADFLIGPLDRDQVAALLDLPDPGLPMLLLNRPPEAGRAGSTWPAQTAILALPPEEEAELAAVNALEAGHQRALVLGQSTDWGRRLADQFAETFRLGGGRVVGRAEYDPAVSDQTERLEVLLELDRSERRIAAVRSVLGSSVEAEPRRRTDVDLVFLAARADDARVVRPQLRFFGAGDLPVYSTSHVHIPGQADPDLQGIELAAAPWFLSSGPHAEARRRAGRQFSGLDNPTLSRLHALGRDALSLAPWLAWMHTDPALPLAGHSGRLRLADGRILERDLPWARITGGGLEPGEPE